MSKQKTPAHKTPGLTRRSSGLMALEQRFMFDGAAVADAVHTLTADSDAALAAPVALQKAEQQAQQKIEQFLQTATDQQVFALLHGDKTAPDAAWSERLAELREMLSQGEAPVQVLMMDKASQFNAVAAFAANGPEGKPTIFVNPYWAGLLGNEDMVGVIVEELGHWMDSVLNPGSDTAGDEGQRLADAVMGKETLTTRADADTDSGWVQVDGVSYEVEFASFNFVNAYEMVYDLDNDTLGKTTAQISTADIDVSERWADKEQNLHYFNSSTSLGVVRISDGTNGQSFSGNDVSAISVLVNGTNYYGWISRPIKANGIVRGFYFWTDDRFTTLQLAQADGNQDGDRTVLNNRGFVFVVDQAWFNTQISSTRVNYNGAAGTPTPQINNTKDGNLGTIWVANVGSSSDRVDSALNSVLTPNSAPTAVNDVLSVGEDSGTTSVTAANGLLKNDTDANSDALTVTTFSVGGVPTAVDPTNGGTYTIANVGTVTINKDGSYSFTPVANYSGPVPPITYTVSDSNGATSAAVLSITVTPANDPPISTNDSRTVNPSTTVVLGLTDFGTYSDPDSDPLAKIIITSLPSTGSLEFYDAASSTWVPVTVNQELTALDINSGKLRVTTATTDMAVGFKVFDGNLVSTSAYTLTITVPAAPALPNASTDSGTGPAYVAIEGVDGAAGTPASGNVLTNDTGSNIRVTAVFNTSVATVGNTTIKGIYGTLTISSNGAYSYAPDNANALVDALNVGGSLTETFNYTITDNTGDTSTSTLTVNISGANDSPVARDDTDSVKELATLTSGNYGTTTGNVLTNDSDVDNNNASLKVVIETSDVVASSGISTSASATSPISSSYFTATQTAGGSLTSRMSAGTSYNFTLVSTGQSVTGSNGLPITVQRSGSGASAQFSFSDTLTILEYPVGTTFEVTGTAGGSDPNIRFETSNFVSVVTSSSNVTLTTTPSQTIQVGYVVTGTNIPANTTVTAVNGDVITLSNSVEITNRTLTFTDPNAVTVNANTGEMLKNGTYGYLRIAENGSYTYTLTSNALNAGQTYTETFTYKTTDGSAQSNTATLRIVIDGTSASFSLSAVNNSLTVPEDTAGTISNVLTNDTNTTTVTGYSWGNQSTATAGTQLSLTGIGTLTISSGGELTFTPATNYTGPVPTVTYTAKGSTGTEQVSADVTISITPANDPPTGSNDVITMPKNTDAILTLGDFGAFSDPDGDAFSGIKVTTEESAGTLSFYNGSSWVDVTLNQVISAADISGGKLKFTPATNAVGSNYATIGFEVYDGTAYSTSAYTLTVNVIDSAVIAAGNPPVNTVPGAQTISDYQTLALTGLSVDDLDNDITSSTLTVTNGSLAVTGAGASGAGTANSPLVLTGNKATIDALLATLVYTPAPGFKGSDVLRIQTLDGIGNSDTDFVSITVNADNRALSVTGTTVNEASPYVYFRVAGVANQLVSLDLDVTGTGPGHAIEGADYLQNLEYFNGSTWQPYTGGFVKIPTGNNLLVRTAVLQDALNEGAETLKLIATNTSGASSAGNSTIKDDGTGSIFLGDNDFVPDTSGPGFPAYLDDDRPVSVNSISVNEASPTGVFTVTGSTGQIVRFALIDRTATAENGTAPVATDGSEDYGPRLQIWNGTSWDPYTPGTDYALTSTTTYIRTAIVDDDPFEGQHNFLLGVTRQAAAVTVYGTGSIYDDGTGSYWIDDATAPASNTDLTTRNITLDDDRTLTINSPLVNEGSDYVVFTLTGNSGQTVTLQLQDESNNGAVSGKANILENQILKIWNGLDWVDYDANNLPTFNAAGKIFVRVDIVAEQDTPYEGGETFKLNATLSGTTTPVTGVATIIDDGTGVKFPGTFNNDGTPATNTTNLDDDRVQPAPPALPLITVTGASYNENSPRAVFTVNATAGQILTLDVQNAAQAGKAPTGDNEGKPNDSLDTAPIYYSLDGGATWQLYTGPVTAGSVPVLVAVDITNERDDVYEGEEQLKLVVTSGNQTAEGFSSIFDDGTGVVTKDITERTTNDRGANDPSVPKDDDRPVTVTGGDYNENSPRAVFTVRANPGQILTLDVQNAAQAGKAPTGDNEGKPDDSLDNAPIYYSLDGGATWQLYTGPITAGNVPVLVAVDITNERDDVYEGEEQLKLVVTTGSQRAEGYSSIFDDGTGVVTKDITERTTNDNGANDPSVPKDDDRPKAVVVVPPPAPTPAVIAAPAPLVAPPPPQAVPPQAFASTLTPLAPALVPVDAPMSLGDAITSGSGYQIPVSESAQPGLSLYQGITDQFIQSTDGVTKISLPFDAFIHSNKDAVIKLDAKQADGSKLPDWVQFDPATGVFQVTPPKGFKGKLDLMVIARDDDGREASALFKMFIGEQEANRPQSRESFTEKLRLAGKRPITLVRVADGAHKAPVREAAVAMRVRAG